MLTDAIPPCQAVQLLREITALANHRFWADEVNLTAPDFPTVALLVGHHQVTDAYLLALAIGRSGRLATLDAAVSALIPSDRPVQGQPGVHRSFPSVETGRSALSGARGGPRRGQPAKTLLEGRLNR